MIEIIRTGKENLTQRKKSVPKWKVPAKVKSDVLRFLSDLDLGKVNRGRKASDLRQIKYLYLLRIPLELFNKEIADLQISDVGAFERALSSGKIKSHFTGKEYSHATKADLRQALKVFLRWRLGQAKAITLAGWLDTRVKKKTPDYLKEMEVEKLLKHCRTAEQRFIVAVLFDSGARAAEFLNLRYEDIQLPEGKENFVKITLKEEYSKTLGRTISLYWRYCVDAVREYLHERVVQGIKSRDPVFAGTYDGMRMFLRRLGKAVVKRVVYPHLFRHSSATFYATKLNRQELCYRYGWRFSSDMPDVYISRSGMENRELDEKFTATELSLLKEDLVKKEQADKIKDDRIRQLENTVTTMQQHFKTIAKTLALNPTIGDVEAVIQRRRTRQLESMSSL